MYPFVFRLLALAVLAGPPSIPAAQAASSTAATEQVSAELVSSVTAVHAGEEILLGVKQVIIPHWHTYWKNPGDSGLATSIVYELPPGTTVGDIQWPTPGRIKLGPVVNYGYEHEVTLLTPVKLPDNLVAGTQLPIRAKANWLVCKESCLPQEVELALELPVLAAGESAGAGSSPAVIKALSQLPVESPWPMTVQQRADGLLLKVAGGKLANPALQQVWFFPDEWGHIAQGAEQPVTVTPEAIELHLKPGDAPLAPGGTLSGVLTISETGGDGVQTKGYKVQAAVVAASAAGEQPATDLILPSAMLLALLGGLVLNLMPCVFPVLSMKALALIGHTGQSAGEIKKHGWLYTLGVLSSFAALSLVLIALKAGGAQIGWGFQFQSPVFVLLAAYLMFVVGLSLSGVFTLGSSVMGLGSNLASRDGYSGSFFTGVLATVVATPCTAPFMGAAVGFALTQPPLSLVSVFLSLGFGLALPYLLLSYWPGLQALLPKPGLWMERFKQALAFPMYGAGVWLIWVLTQQAGADAVLIALGGMLAIAFAGWLFETTKASPAGIRCWATAASGVLIVVALYGSYQGLATPTVNPAADQPSAGARDWQAFSPAKLASLRAEGKPVFVNFTAAWCISCLVNEQVALSQDSVKQALKDKGITYLKGDWTQRDEAITQALAEFGRSGVPLYLYYPPGLSTKPVILPQILTPDIVIQAFAENSVPLISLRQ